MQGKQLRTIAIVGGGLAGWMAAATLARLLNREHCRIEVIERPRAPALGAGEATIPAFQRFNNLLGIAENGFVRATRATFGLGVEFSDWSRPGRSYFHTFGPFGGVIASVPFHHFWLKLRGLGDETPIEDYSMAAVAAKLGRFTLPAENSTSLLSLFSHAYHFDRDLYVNYLRDYALARGVEQIDREAVDAELSGADGFIETVVLDDARRVEADFFIDCTGFPGLLIERKLRTGYEDWSRWLPCDRAVCVASPGSGETPNFTRSITRQAGWQWSLPLQGRVDNGYVYCSRFIGDDEAAHALLGDHVALPGVDPRFSRFISGQPRKFWNRNCLALPGGFMEPLESTHVHLIQTGILKLFGAFPDRSFNPSDSDEYNRLANMEYERIRDFLVLHYAAAGRDDSSFWKHCRDIAIPDSLRHKIELFRNDARVNMLDNEHFAEQSWISVFLGKDIVPRRYDPLADVPDVEEVARHLRAMAATIRQAVQDMPTHAQFLSRIGRGEGVSVS